MKKKFSKKSHGVRKLILLAIPIIFIGTTLAKFSSNTNQDVVFEAKNFYFESDLLHDATNPISYTYQKGVDEISVILKNNIDEYRFSDVEIEYKVQITDQEGNSVNDKNGVKVEAQEGKLSNTKIIENEIKFSNLPTGIYVVKAEAIKPYTKTLQAIFTITNREEEIIYEVNDEENSPIVYVTMKTIDYSGNILIAWPSGVYPDSTNSFFENTETGVGGGTTTISFNSNSEYSFQFFKNNPTTVYTKNDFIIEREV